MLRAKAYPFPIFEDTAYQLVGASFGNSALEIKQSSKGFVIVATQLRQWSEGSIRLDLEFATTVDEVRLHTFGESSSVGVSGGVRVLCKDSKFRTFFPVTSGAPTAVELPLEKSRGVIALEPVFVSDTDGAAINGETIPAGSVIGTAREPMFITIDEDWTGETIPVDWLDFSTNQLPDEAFLHVELRGGSDTPVVWLNKKYRSRIEPALLRVGDNSPAALAGSAMRQLIWAQVWEKVLLWAIKERSADNENWPASRIAAFWASRFRLHSWSLPNPDELDAAVINETAVRIQHCLLTAQQLAHVNRVLRFQPESP